jgi:diguanylate cyclase (GGDEF)-like protein
MRLLEGLDRLPTFVGAIVSGALVMLIGLLDYLTGFDFSVTALYLFPLFLLAWKAGRGAALAGAAVCTAARTLADALAGAALPSPAAQYWNTGTRLFLFVVIGLVTAELKRLLDHERALAVTDSLTGAANSRAFLEALRHEIDRSRRYRRPFTLVYFDLDNFKRVNDTFGHAEGDAVLRIIVNEIRGHGRVTDTVGRMGGDEFAILMPETGPAQARTAVANLKDRVVRALAAGKWGVTISFGVVTSMDDEEEPDPLIRRADALMYEAKASGKNAVRFG